MRAKLPDVMEKGRIAVGPYRTRPGDRYGAFVVRHPAGAYLQLLASDGVDWFLCGMPTPAFEHVSVSLHRDATRCPTWEEMAWVKSLCWGPDECVVQYHPPESEYVNHHPTCLHLWKPVGVDFPMPPAVAVGPKGRP